MSTPIASPRTIHMIEAVPDRLEGSPRHLRRFWSDAFKALRRTKAAMIYKATGNLRAIQILLGHTKIEDALELAEHTEI